MKHRTSLQKRPRAIKAFVSAVVGAAVIAGAVAFYNRSADPIGPLPVPLPATPQSYLGVYVRGTPESYAGVTAFSRVTGTRPDIAMYYSGWYVPFPAKFAATAASEGVVPLVQMDPDSINVAAIASGRYDAYLSSYAEAVRAFRNPVILSFGHEMNGNWYSWGYQHTSPAVFVAAWRHIVRLFRALRAHNVTWLWTVNVINDSPHGNIPRPAAWWPGSSYVDWVGIDGYYLKRSWAFAPLFGPTIAAVHALTQDPIIIAETGAVPAAAQASKITNLFAGVHSYGLLGFVWFDSANSKKQIFRIEGPASVAALRKGARTFVRPGT